MDDYRKCFLVRLTDEGWKQGRVLDDGGHLGVHTLTMRDGVVGVVFNAPLSQGPREAWAWADADSEFSRVGYPADRSGAIATCRDSSRTAYVFWSGQGGVLERHFIGGVWSQPRWIRVASMPERLSADAIGDTVCIVCSYAPTGPIEAVLGRGENWGPPVRVGGGHVASVVASDGEFVVSWAESTPPTTGVRSPEAPDGTWVTSRPRIVTIHPE